MTSSLRELERRIQILEQKKVDRREIISFPMYKYPTLESAKLAVTDTKMSHREAFIIQVFCQTRKGLRFQNTTIPFTKE